MFQPGTPMIGHFESNGEPQQLRYLLTSCIRLLNVRQIAGQSNSSEIR